MKVILKKILYSIFCLILVSATLFIDNRKFAQASRDSFDSIFNKTTAIRLDDGTDASVSLDESAAFPSIKIRLRKGKLWINTSNSIFKTIVETGGSKIEAQPGVFDVSYIGSDIKSSAHGGSAQISFLGNALIIPQNRSLKLNEARIKASMKIFSKLRYTKLSKEFPLEPVGEFDPRVKDNISKDEKFARELKAEFIRSII